MAAMTREGRKGGHQPSKTLSQVVEMRKQGGNGTQEEDRLAVRDSDRRGRILPATAAAAATGGRSGGRQGEEVETPGKSSRGPGGGGRGQARDSDRRGRIRPAIATAAAKGRRSGGRKGGSGRIALRWGRQAVVREEDDGDGSETVIREEESSRPQRRRRAEKVEPGEEELHFENADEVRPWSRRRRTSMGLGRWSETNTSVGHSGGCSAAPRRRSEETGDRERKCKLWEGRGWRRMAATGVSGGSSMVARTSRGRSERKRKQKRQRH